MLVTLNKVKFLPRKTPITFSKVGPWGEFWLLFIRLSLYYEKY